MIYGWIIIFASCAVTILGRNLNDNNDSILTNTRTIKCQSSEAGQILMKIREKMKNAQENGDGVQAYIIQMNDAHQSEYIADRDKRIKFATNFSGSAGEAVITESNAALWTDSRYFLQAEQQINLDCWTLMKQGSNENGPVPTLTEWLSLELTQNESKIGVDPFTITNSHFQSISNALANHNLVSLQRNLIDEIWTNRPVQPKNKIFPLDIQFSGKTSHDKISELREKLKEHDAEYIVITTLDDNAWLLNLRGSDIEYNPVFFSYVLLSETELYLFVDKEKITNLALEEVNVVIKPYEAILDAIKDMVNKTVGKFLISDNVSQAIYESIPDDRKLIKKNIVARMKTIKNDIEAENLHKAHIRDGMALIQYLHWLDENIDIIKVTEISGAKKLKEFRSQQENFRGLSFETISAFGSNAAMAHYSPTNETDRQITRDEIYLVDSGGQYWDGTTDVTRTMHFGIPTDFEKECFTRVLKGFIAMVASVFPPNTALSYFDYVARRPLWQAGLDYGHGTGHGVGAYLFVHEYPPLIGKTSGSDPGALVNMFTSDEPGFYKDGQFGIRIEDVIQVVEAKDINNNFSGNGALTFKSITYAPLQTKMIERSLLDLHEVKYINKYNKLVLNTIGPLLLKGNFNSTYNWLFNETQPIIWPPPQFMNDNNDD